MNLGAVLRKKRKEKGFTLKSVAEKAGISEGFLSQVENDVSSPSVETLIKICNAIGINAGDIITEAEKKERLAVIRKAEWESDVEIPKSGFITRRFYTPESRYVIDSSVMALEPGASIPGRKGIKNSQEILCVLKGTVQISCGNETATLHVGDAIHYHWSAPENQIISNKSKGLSVVLWVGTL
jgi:transcriptional regulator with XRE-family HTH domain